MRVIKTEEWVEFHKRQGLPFLIEDTCPACRTVCVFNLHDRYLGNSINLHGVTQYSGYCDTCYHEWPIPLKIRVTIEEG
jgi:hypothetical protein